MILFTLGGLLLIFGPFISIAFMVYYIRKQHKDLTLWEEYEEKIIESFTFGFVITPLIALFIIILGVSCLNT